MRRGPTDETLDPPDLGPARWGVATGEEPPTHLPDDFELGTDFARDVYVNTGRIKKKHAVQSASRSRSESIVTSAPRPSKSPTLVKQPAPLPHADEPSASASRSARGSQPRPLPQAHADEPSASASRSARGSQPRPLPQPPQPGGSQPKIVVADQRSAHSQSASRSKSSSAPSPSPQPAPMPGPGEQPPPFMQFNGGAAFDPNAIPLPPELASPVFNWVRRLALQADLVAADKLLRDAVADLTNALSVTIIYAGPEGFYTLGPDGELPKDLQPVMAVGKARRALVGPHSGLVPIATSSECIGVIQLVRNVRQPAFGTAEHITMAAIARESAAVLHHLVVQHLQGKIEQQADKKSLYRPEALQYHRKKGSEGVVAELSPKWTRRAYPFLLVTMLVAIIAGLVVRVPTYSSGFGIVRRASTPVTSLAQGNVEAIYAQRGDTVKKGDRLAKLSSPKEEGDYAQVKTEWSQAQDNYLFDDQDEQARKQVKAATTALVHAQGILDQRYVYATADGVVSDIHTDEGKAVQPGQELMRIIKPGTKPEILAFLPSTDRPRVKHDMKLQVGVEGFKLKRPRLAIDNISEDVVGPSDIRRMVGQEVADTLKLPNEGVSFMVVKGTFESDKFKSGHKIYELHDGMPAKVEIEIDTKPFLAEVFPLFERWVD